MMIKGYDTNSKGSTNNRYRKVEDALKRMQATRTDFTAKELAFEINQNAATTAGFLKFTSGVRTDKKGKWFFTGEPICVDTGVNA